MRRELDHFDSAERAIAEHLIPLLEQNGALLYRTEIAGRREARIGWPSTRADGHRTWVFVLEAKDGEVELTLWVGADSGLIGSGGPLRPKAGDRPKERDCGSIRLASTRFPAELREWVAKAYNHAQSAVTPPP